MSERKDLLLEERFESLKGYGFSVKRDLKKDSGEEKWRVVCHDKSSQVFVGYSSSAYAGLLMEMYANILQNNQEAFRASEFYRKRLERLILVARDEKFSGDQGIVLQLVQKKGQYALLPHEVKRKKEYTVSKKDEQVILGGDEEPKFEEMVANMVEESPPVKVSYVTPLKPGENGSETQNTPEVITNSSDPVPYAADRYRHDPTKLAARPSVSKKIVQGKPKK